MIRIISSIILAWLIVSTAIAHEYNIVILNGSVMDPESGFDDIRNVGIKDGEIAVITKNKISGSENVDASGHVVTAGFIDTHFHSLDEFAVKIALRDGVTTGMDLEYGAWPIDAWYMGKDGNWPMNYGTLVSQEVVRMIVHDELVVDEYMDAVTAFSVGRTFAAKDGVNGWSVTLDSWQVLQLETFT
jgi:N-acyl-D-glutamate deacylase